MADESTVFEVDHVFTGGPWATVRWRYRFGPTEGESVLGVNVTRVSEGRVIEQLGYTKTPGDVLPLPEDGTGAEATNAGEAQSSSSPATNSWTSRTGTHTSPPSLTWSRVPRGRRVHPRRHHGRLD